MSSKKDNWKKHISNNLQSHLYLVDEKYISLNEEDRLIRKSILAEKQVYDNYKLHKQKKKDAIRSLMEIGDAFLKNKNMSSYTKAKELKIIYKRLVKAGAPKVGLQYLLYSLQQKELYQGKGNINLINEYYKHDVLEQQYKKK
tara:strand:+ start:10067 stop:10495 length:429 start_codon:yes stop_codon:yes gene_type:complete